MAGSAWSNQAVVAALVDIIAGSPGTGLFVYSPTAAAGNLVASIAPAAGTDAFGNTVHAGITSYGGLNTAILNASALTLFAGIIERATLSTSHFTVFNSSGATIYDVDLSRAAQFLYHDTGSASQGGLVASQSQNSGTDQFGNTYDAGVVAYDPVNAIVGQLFSGVLSVGTTGQFAGTGGAVVARVSLNLGNSAGSLFLQSGLTATGDTQARVELDSANLSGITGGEITATTGKMIVAAADGNTYRTERLDVTLATNFTINSTSPQTIFSASLGVGTYEVDIWGVVLNATAADAASFAFAFTGTATAALVDFTSMTTGTATVGYGASATLTTAFTNQGVAGNQKVEAHLGVTVSVAGTLTFTGKELVAANTITMFAGSRMRVCPV